MQPLVSIISVNYNQVEVTCDLLESLRSISYKNIEIIIVDNSSNEDPSSIQTRYPEINFIQSPDNLGFAGGNNLAIIASKGEYILFLNNDTEVTPDFLEPLIEQLKANPKIGMVSPKIRFYHTPDTIQYAGYTPMNPYTQQQQLVGYRQKDDGSYNITQSTYSIHGAAMCVPRKVILEVGMMAELFFLYYEEHDWAFRIKLAGYETWYVANSLVYHKESVSTGRESPLKTHYIARNRVLYARRNYSGIVFILNMLFVNCIALPKNLLKYLFLRRFDLAKAYIKAAVWNVTHFKDIHESPKLAK